MMENNKGKRPEKKDSSKTVASAAGKIDPKSFVNKSKVASMRSGGSKNESGDESDFDSMHSSTSSDLAVGKKKSDKSDTTPKPKSGMKKKTPTDTLAQLRRKRRLEMNRLSARERRKKQKLQIETLQSENSKLTETNRQFRLDNEMLSAKVHTLQNELSRACNTINQLVQQRPLSVSGSASPALLAGSQRLLEGTTGSGSSAVARLPGSVPGQQDDPNYNRTMQPQLNEIALQQQHRQQIGPNNPIGIGFGSSISPSDPILRRHALDIDAFSQANRDNAVESMINSRGLGGFHSPNITGTLSGIHPEQYQNTLARSNINSFGSLGDGRINNDQYTSAASMRLSDAVLAREEQSTTSGQLSSHLLDELIRQQSRSNQRNFPP